MPKRSFRELGFVLLATFAAICVWSVAIAVSSEQPTLKIGDPAPKIEPMAWLQGTPIAKYERGRVYVIEFWATWCPPCLRSIPHLSALQQKYSSTLTIVGVNAEGLLGNHADLNKVHDFMNRHGKEMTYTVAMEDPIEKPISEQWVTGTGSMGAPTAGIIDRYGKLVWIGYPDVVKGYAFDEALEDTLAGKIDLARSRALQLSTSRETAAYWAKHSDK
jgi:thiol-disulfide isomerase/thioredoxin